MAPEKFNTKIFQLFKYFFPIRTKELSPKYYWDELGWPCLAHHRTFIKYQRRYVNARFSAVNFACAVWHSGRRLSRECSHCFRKKVSVRWHAILHCVNPLVSYKVNATLCCPLEQKMLVIPFLQNTIGSFTPLDLQSDLQHNRIHNQQTFNKGQVFYDKPLFTLANWPP